MMVNNDLNVPLVKGWVLTSSDFAEAWREGKLLTAQIETSNLCDLLCDYCFREELGAKSKRRLPGEMTLGKTFEVIDELSTLGVRTVNIIGAGEPTLDPGLEVILGYIASKHITPVLFTHGGRIDDDLLHVLDATGTSVIVKMNSFNNALQDRIVGRRGYSSRRDAGLDRLLAAGFNEPREGYVTRLGIDSVVTRDNYDEILDIHQFCRERNIMPLIKTFIPAGRTKERTDMEVTREEFLELSKKVREIDTEEYGLAYRQLLPYLGGVPCTQCSKASMYITIQGDIYECPGQTRHYGNIRETTIPEAFDKIKAEQKENFSCPPRIAYWKK
jgi:MoaA/NifB/PqqE/SkfB family radical SAM enzyme